MSLKQYVKPVKKILIALLSFCGVIAVMSNSDTRIEVFNRMSVQNNTAALFLFILLLYLSFAVFRKHYEKNIRVLTLIFSFIFAIAQVLGNCIHETYSIDGLFNGFFGATLTGVKLIGYAYLAAVTLLTLSGIKLSGKTDARKYSLIKTFVILWVIIFVVRIPFLIWTNPGVLNYDSINQLQQVLGRTPYVDHHPILHTYMVGALVKGGVMLFGKVTQGVFLYSIVQTILLSAVFAFTLWKMKKWGGSNRVIYVSLVFFAFFPIHIIHAMTMIKDVLFSGIFLLFVIMLFDMTINAAFFNQKRNWLYFMAVSLLLILLRKQGIYIWLASMVVSLIFLKIRRVLILSFISLGLLILFNSIIFNAFGIEHGKSREALSVPMQAFARVCRDNGESVKVEEKAYLSRLFNVEDIEEIAALYNPQVSDPIKLQFDDAYFQENKGQLFKTYAAFLVRYPKTCFEAFLNGSYGYWTIPEGRWWYRSYWITVYPNDLSIAQANSAWADKTDLYIDRLTYIPVLSLLFVPGLYFWLLMAVIFMVLSKKNYRLFIPLLPAVIIWMTCLVSPVFGEFRYIYPMVCTIPFYIFIVLNGNHYE